MGQPKFIRLSNNTETSVKAEQSREFAYRYAYARSHDSQKEKEPGQDILFFLEDGIRLAFVLCDGVSQSFFGDLAAKELARTLLGWLWKQTKFDTDSTPLSLASLLQNLVGETQQKVAKYPLPTDISEMLRSVLEQKRNDVGSESMFVAGLVDTSKGEVLFAWLGDSRLRIWDQNMQETTSLLGDSFHSHERWYSNKGIVGLLHVQILPIDKVFHITAYSDGLACLDSFSNPNLPNQQIQSFVDLSGGDDDSFIQISIGLMSKEWDNKTISISAVIAPPRITRDVYVNLPPANLPPSQKQPKYSQKQRNSRFFYLLVGLSLLLLLAISLLTVKVVTIPHNHLTITPSVVIFSQVTETFIPQISLVPTEWTETILTSTPIPDHSSTQPSAPHIQKGR